MRREKGDAANPLGNKRKGGASLSHPHKHRAGERWTAETRLGNGDFAVDLSPAPLSEKGSRAVARVGAPVTESARERAGVTIPEFERAIEEAPAAELPGLLGELERLLVLAWQQMTARLLAGSRGEPGRFADRLTVTTAEAAEWLGLEESHVPDICP